MPDYYEFICKSCGYQEKRYRNLKRCRHCGGEVERLKCGSLEHIRKRVELRQLHYSLEEVEYLLTLVDRAEKAEAENNKLENVIRGMFPMWINAMGYCEHGKPEQLKAMRNYYNGRDNPMTADEIHTMFSIIPNSSEGKK
jgi:hypothetical protein